MFEFRKLRHRSNPEHIGELDDNTFIKCHECGKLIAPWETFDSKYCEECAEIIKNAKKHSLHKCVGCEEFFPLSELYKSKYCPKCSKKLRRCRSCREEFIPEDKFVLCPTCHDELVKECIICKKEFIPKGKSHSLCPSCQRKENRNQISHKIVKKANVKDTEVVNNDRTVELLIKALQDVNTRSYAVENLIKIGKNSVKPIIESFNSEHIEVNGKDREEIRNSLIDVLIGISENSVDPLIKSLEDIDFLVRKNSAKALGKIGDERAVEPLINTLDDHDSFVRRSSAKALGLIGNIMAVEPLIESLGDANSYVRVASAKALGLIGDGRAVEPLIESLNDDMDAVRSVSARALGSIGTETSVPFLYDLLNDENHNVVESAKKAIFEITGEEIGENVRVNEKSFNKDEFLSLINELFDGAQDTRVSAAKTLGNIKSDKSTEYLIKALEDPEDGVKIEVLRSLGKLRDPKALNDIIIMFKEDSLKVIWAAVESLSSYGSDALDALSEALKNDDEGIRYHSVHSLIEIEDERVIDILAENLKDPDVDVRKAIAESLGKTKDIKAINPLMELIKDENIEVSKSAVRSMSKIHDEKVIKVLTGSLDDFEFPLKNVILKLIKKVEKRIESENSRDVDELSSSKDSDSDLEGLNIIDNNNEKNSLDPEEKSSIELPDENSDLDEETPIKIVDDNFDLDEEDPFELLDQIKKSV